MTPRPYRMDQRALVTGETRARVIAAARDILNASAGMSASGGWSAAFTVEAIASRAGVARMTVYYQFGSKGGLVEALFDHLSADALMTRLPAAYARENPDEALAAVIDAFTHFWGSDRLVMRRISALGALDPAVESATRARDDRRRIGMGWLVGRIADQHAGTPAVDEAIQVLFMLTSFETFDRLSGPDRTREDVTRTIQRLARCALGVPVQEDG